MKKEIRESFYEYSNETLNVTLRKDKDYRVVFEVKKDEKPVDSRVINLRNLDTLIPRNKELRVILKDADFRVVGVDNRTVRVQVRFYLESMDDYEILFHVKAIQYESNVLADERWILKKVKSGATTLVYCNITVPRDYNYLIKLEAWRKGSLLKTWKSCLNLAPKKRIPKEEVEEEVKFRVEEFVKTPIPLPTPTPLPYRAKEGKIPMAPGFEALLLIIALGGVVFCLRRRR